MKMRPLIRFLALTALLAGGLYGCERSEDPAGPVAQRPAYTLGTAWTALNTVAPVRDTTVKVVLGRSGGLIRVGDHVLWVPANAVTENTEFSFHVVGGNTVTADLTAKRTRDGVAVTRFQRTLLLQLSWKDAVVPDPKRLFIGYLTAGKRHGIPAGVVENLLTNYSLQTQTVSSLLTHFSEYEIGVN